MKKITFNVLLAFAICFATACENKRESSENVNESTTTDKTGSDGDELVTDKHNTTDVGMAHTTDSTKITTGTPGTPIYTSDAAFVMKVLSSNKLEVELGKIAAKRGTSPDIKKFGQHLVDDHAAAFTELISLAEKKKWEVPQKMIPTHKSTFDLITKKTGKDFDKEFIAELVKDHEMDIAEFEQATKKAADTDLKAFASKTLPKLRMHLDMARELDSKMKDIK